MKYKETKDYLLINDKMQNMFDYIEKESIDAIVTDPPYGLTSITKRFGKEGSAPALYGKDGAFSRLSKGFMGQEWDGTGVEYSVDTWQKCYDALKPGGYLLAFGGSRTYHRIACAIEDSGFEIRDCIMWLYGSGFPKSMNIGLAIDKKNGVESPVVGRIKGAGSTGINSSGNQTFVSKNQYEDGTHDIKQAQNEWQGWGTCLKPAYEPIIVARKPFKGSLIENIMENGVGGLNIDECRVAFDGEDAWKPQKSGKSSRAFQSEETTTAGGECSANENGRFPANVILTYDETDKEEVCGGFPDTKSQKRDSKYNKATEYTNTYTPAQSDYRNDNTYDDSGSAARYFYCAKASKKDRDEGLELFDSLKVNDGRQTPIDNPFQRGESLRKNIHPTVKPVELMQYLVRLVAPKGSTVMDCFMGSGSTGKAVMFENREREANYKFIGIEMTDEYLPICESRIEYALNKYEYDAEIENKKDHEEGRLNIFDFIEEDVE